MMDANGEHALVGAVLAQVIDEATELVHDLRAQHLTQRSKIANLYTLVRDAEDDLADLEDAISAAEKDAVDGWHFCAACPGGLAHSNGAHGH